VTEPELSPLASSHINGPYYHLIAPVLHLQVPFSVPQNGEGTALGSFRRQFYRPEPGRRCPPSLPHLLLCSAMLRYDLMVLIAAAIRRKVTRLTESQALDTAEEVLDELEQAGLHIEKRPAGKQPPEPRS
jgi:hypothetical protein